MRVTPVARRTILTTVAWLAAPSVALACSNDEFAVEKTPVGIELCAPAPVASSEAGRRAAGTLRATVTAHGRRLPVQSIPFDRTAAGEVARTIGDVSLVPLGIARTLHLTISVRGDDVRIEHALVVPGAIVLK